MAESGPYKLVLRSRKPEALQFQDWVTREVLPSIRKNGAYIAGQEGIRDGTMSREVLIAKALQAACADIATERPVRLEAPHDPRGTDRMGLSRS